MMNTAEFQPIINFIWGVADDLLRDVYVKGKYRDVILPMTVIRRIDVVLELTIPLPPIEDQKVIVEFLDKGIEKINSIITKIKEQIKFYKEYKQTPISETTYGRTEIKTKEK